LAPLFSFPLPCLPSPSHNQQTKIAIIVTIPKAVYFHEFYLPSPRACSYTTLILALIPLILPLPLLEFSPDQNTPPRVLYSSFFVHRLSIFFLSVSSYSSVSLDTVIPNAIYFLSITRLRQLANIILRRIMIKINQAARTPRLRWGLYPN
jgi:hypothetical protein